jgi:hypothetical protein
MDTAQAKAKTPLRIDGYKVIVLGMVISENVSTDGIA